MTQKHPVHKAAAEEKVPMLTRIGWGFGGLADNFMFNTIVILGTLVYVDHFKMDPALAGMALGFPRLIDAITDLWIGNWSDNFKSRWGRRIPFMFMGVLLCTILLPLMWNLPMVETAQNPIWSNVPFLYICVMGSLLATSYTLFVVPYTALGFELTPNYDERTRVVRWRMYIGLAASLTTGWLYRFAAADCFDDIGSGAFWVTVVVALVVLASGMIPVILCKEKVQTIPQEKIRIIPAVKYTMSNKSFIILFIAYMFIIVALFSAQGIAPLLMLNYIFEGDPKALGTFQGQLQIVAVALSYVSVWIIGYISTRSNKRMAMVFGLSCVFVGVLCSYWAMDPRWPWAMFITNFIAFLGMQGCWLMIDSMTADVCDDDELKSGRRREGMFSAVKGFALKAAQALTFGIGGYMATYAGYDQNAVDAGGLDHDVATKMKMLIIGFQSIGLLIAIFIFKYYPITREKAEETRRLLDERKAAADAAE